MYKRIMVPVDGTTFSEQALPHAVALALKGGAALSVVMVERPPLVSVPHVEVPAPLYAVALEYLEEVADRIHETGVTDVSVAMLTGDVHEALETHRDGVDAQLTVMCTHGHGPVARAWIGSVADHFVRTTSAPVLLVRPVSDVEEVSLSGALGFSNILVTLDGSPLSESAIEPALALGYGFDVKVTLANLVEYPNHLESVYLPDAIEVIRKKIEDRRRAAEEELDVISERLEAEGNKVDRVSRVVAHVAEGILACAAERGADVIAMASHGRGGVQRLLLGSVADKVLRGADRPVLIVRAGTA